MIEIEIWSQYNGRTHRTVIKRVERVGEIYVNGELVYSDERHEESILPNKSADKDGKKN